MQFESTTTTLVGNLLIYNVSLVDKSTNIMKVGSVSEILTGRGTLAQQKDTEIGDHFTSLYFIVLKKDMHFTTHDHI